MREREGGGRRELQEMGQKEEIMRMIDEMKNEKEEMKMRMEKEKETEMEVRRERGGERERGHYRRNRQFNN